jgi:NAD(P)-dependent dehydrogenase (short-subunit alcohol dehydrogenase family)
MTFQDRAAVVTGGASGMGLQIARDLVKEGAKVTLIDLSALDAVDVGAGADRVLRQQGDVSDDAFVAGAMRATAERFGRIDFLVNAAGVLWFGKDASLADMDMGLWDRVLQINLKGSALTARHAVPIMKKNGGGAMVHFSSMQCYRGDDRPQDAYQASKAAVIAMSKSIAIQFAADKIRSNVVVPGPTETPMQDRWNKDPSMKGRTAAVVPLGRVGTAVDMSNATLFLLSDKASYITGTELIVDGGWLARP